MELEFMFNDECKKVNPRCDFCRRTYDPNVQIEFGHPTKDGSPWGGSEICPRCLRKGPKAAAEMARKRSHSRIGGAGDYYAKLADAFEHIGDFREIPGGITAMKIVEAYEEIKAATRKRKAA